MLVKIRVVGKVVIGICDVLVFFVYMGLLGNYMGYYVDVCK